MEREAGLSSASVIREVILVADHTFYIVLPVDRVHTTCPAVREEIVLLALASSMQIVCVSCLHQKLFGDIVNWDNIRYVVFVSRHVL